MPLPAAAITREAVEPRAAVFINPPPPPPLLLLLLFALLPLALLLNTGINIEDMMSGAAVTVAEEEEVAVEETVLTPLNVAVEVGVEVKVRGATQ